MEKLIEELWAMADKYDPNYWSSGNFYDCFADGQKSAENDAYETILGMLNRHGIARPNK